MELVEASANNNLKKVKELVNKGVNVNTEDHFGSNSLFLASVYGHIEVVKFLIESKANLDSQHPVTGLTALLGSVMRGRHEIVLTLLKNGADIRVRDFSGNSVILIASAYGRLELLELLIEYGADIYSKNNKGENVFDCFKGEEKQVKYIIDRALEKKPESKVRFL